MELNSHFHFDEVYILTFNILVLLYLDVWWGFPRKKTIILILKSIFALLNLSREFWDWDPEFMF